ncbi:MAG: MBL fold metallo-hydrolase [Prevotella sp.]|nr:MBL fold metallo-hydrolase [Prevotella sp.]
MNKLQLSIISTFFMALSACADNPVPTDTFKTQHGKEVVLTAIKHASIRISYDGMEIEVDPVGAVEPKTDYARMPKADYILVTHEHFDHFDAKAIADLEKAGTLIVTNENCAQKLGRGRVMHNGDSLTLADDITVKAVPAYNITPGHTQYHPKGRDNGFVLTLDGLRIYIAGDTEDIDEMQKLKDIDVAFLPTNQPYTMTPKQTARAAHIIRPKVLFPYHFSETPIERVADLLKDSGIDVRIRSYK